VFENALSGFEGQIETGKRCITLLQLVDNTKGLKVVLKSTVLPTAPVEDILTRVSKGRMA